MTDQQLEVLYDKCVHGRASAEERREFLYLMGLPENEELAAQLIKRSLQLPGSSLNLKEESADQIFQSIILVQETKTGEDGDQVRRLHWPTIRFVRYAAAIILIIGATTYFFQADRGPKITSIPTVSASEDVLPGSEKAILTLSDGRKISLNDSGSRKIQDRGLSIVNEDGRLLYSKTEFYGVNTITTPNGGQYKLRLADGTNVWLNAASSITYPTAFIGERREVTITGEAYFEVSENKQKPFIVKTYSDVITVVGTIFNVNAYTDESATKTSLLQGTVKINNYLLKPGQAFQSNQVIKTDIARDVAWKNGVFNFESVNTEKLMRQLARWYDIKIVYYGAIPEKRFHGKLGRDLKLSQILEVIQQFNINCELQGRTLTIKSTRNNEN